MNYQNHEFKPARSVIIASFFALVVLLLPAPGWSQAARQGKKPDAAPEDNSQPKVNIGVSTAKPGDVIDIPLTLSAPDTINVNSIVETLSFPKKVLSLSSTELGLAGEQSNADIKTDITDDSADPTQSDLVATITSKGTIKPGILAYLKFKVSTDATKSTVVLKAMDTKLGSSSGAPVEVAKGKDGEVTIFNLNEEIPVVGCFFFSH